MKFKIIALSVLALALARAGWQTVQSVIDTKLALSTINGGASSYAIYNAYVQEQHVLISVLFVLMVVVIFSPLSWWGGHKNNHENPKPTQNR